MSAETGARALSIIEVAAAQLTTELRALLTSIDDALAGPSQERVRHAATLLSGRLRLLLMALTPANTPMDIAEVVALAAGLPEHVNLDAGPVDPAARFAPAFGRVLLNLLLLAADSLPHGGLIRLAGSADELFVQIAGPRAGWPDGTALCLANEAAANQALQEGRAPRAALSAVLAHEAGIRLSTVFLATGGAPPILRLGGA